MSSNLNFSRDQRQRVGPNELFNRPNHVPLPPQVQNPNQPGTVWNRPGVIVNGYKVPGPSMVTDAIEENIRYRNAIQNQSMNGAIPRAKVFNGPTSDDLFNAAGRTLDAENAFSEPIYRTSWITANSRYAKDATVQQSLPNLVFPIARDQMDRNQPMLLLNENSLQDIVAIRFDEAILPSSMFSAGELYLGRLMVRFPAFSGPALGSYDYFGPTNNTTAAPYHFECNMTVDGNRVKIVPVEPFHIFPSPARLNDSDWSINVMTPTRQFVSFPSPFITGISAATNPIQLTILNHGLTAPNYATIETTGLSTTYVPYSELYPITIIDPNTISLPINGTSIAPGTSIQLCIASNIIRFHMRLMSLDKKSDVTAGTRFVAAMSH